MSSSGASVLVEPDFYSSHPETALSGLRSALQYVGFLDIMMRSQRSLDTSLAGFSETIKVYIEMIQEHRWESNDIRIPQEDMIGSARTMRRLWEAVIMSRTGDIREEMVDHIAAQFRNCDRVDEVNVDMESDPNMVVFTVLVDMPEYDRKLLKTLRKLELEWAKKVARWGFNIMCIYLPSQYVEPGTRLTTDELDSLM